MKSFSLRNLMILVAVLAVAGYVRRLPKTVDVSLAEDKNYADAVGMRSLWGVWQMPLPKRTEAQQFRRTNFVDYTRHGETLVTDSQNRKIQVQRWSEGRQVRCEYWFRDHTGRVVSHGKTVRGKPHGVWKWFAACEENPNPQTWFVDGPDYDYQLFAAYPFEQSPDEILFGWNRWKRMWVKSKELKDQSKRAIQIVNQPTGKIDSDSPIYEFEFKHGDLIRVNENATPNFLSRFPKQQNGSLAVDLFHSITVSNLSHRSQMFEMMQTLFMGVPMAVKAKRDDFVSCVMHGAPLPHLATLYLVLETNNLVLDYRFGYVYVTTPELASDWQDTTGVNDLFTDSPSLTKFIEQKFVFDFQHLTNLAAGVSKYKISSLRNGASTIEIPHTVEGHLATFTFLYNSELNKKLQYRFANEADGMEKVVSSSSDTKIYRGVVTLRQAFGVLLSELGMRCENEGETIVIYKVNGSANRQEK